MGQVNRQNYYWSCHISSPNLYALSAFILDSMLKVVELHEAIDTKIRWIFFNQNIYSLLNQIKLSSFVITEWIQCTYQKWFWKHIFKVHTFWECQKILRNLHLTFDCHYIGKNKVKNTQNFVAFSEYMNFITVDTLNL